MSDLFLGWVMVTFILLGGATFWVGLYLSITQLV